MLTQTNMAVKKSRLQDGYKAEGEAQPIQILTIWDDQTKISEIKKLYAPTLTDNEFSIFMGVAKAAHCNPYLREIWALKYKSDAPASIFIGRDGYRKGAQQHPVYDYHQSDAVYENDDFCVKEGKISHSYKCSDRGKLIGAYCIAKRKNSTRPIYVYVEAQEYNPNDPRNRVWSTKPATMIKKVAEAQCLRAAFQDMFSGTYSEEEKMLIDAEYSEQPQNAPINTKQTRTEILKQLIDNKPMEKTHEDIQKTTTEILHKEMAGDDGNIPGVGTGNEEPAPSNEKNTPAATQSQILDLLSLMEEKNISEQRKNDALHYFKVSSFDALSFDQANLFIKWIADDKLNKKDS